MGIITFGPKVNPITPEYIYICELTWGCVPIDVVWAKNTDIYKNKRKNLCKS